jgi:uncharacterized damage-inducible protein DinB
MLVQTLTAIFIRDLNNLKKEITAYQNEATIWAVDKGIANSAGNLCLHLIGNLNTYIGAEIGKSDYIRNRDFEFSAKGIAKTELLLKLDDTIQAVTHALNLLTEEDLPKEYPMTVFAEPMTYEFFLVHLSAHLSYHLGQISYHRRLLDVA